MEQDFDRVRNAIKPGPALAAFDYLLAHAAAAGFRLVPHASGTVRSIGFRWAERSMEPFSTQAHPAHINFYMRRPILAEHTELFDAAARIFGTVKPNRLGEYRTHLHSTEEVDKVLDFLRCHGAWPSHRHAQRFVAATFQPVNAEHFLRASRRLAAGFASHRFGESTRYDLLFDGHRLPPKAVFGLAASDALGFQVSPENFTAGDATQSFRMLRDAGYAIVPKSHVPLEAAVMLNDEDRSWTEGKQSLVTHLSRERGIGLAAAKRDRFRAEHGRLFCERCEMNPIETFGSNVGEACIEVHHRRTQLAEMGDCHETRLEDLICLCANCHRVTHRELKDELAAASN